MTLDEAIEIYEIRANTHEREAEYHRPLGYSHEAIANVVEMQAREERQIAKWLKELKERRADRKTEPQTDCGDFADRLAYERGVKHAWEVAQKVFDSTVTFYEAEDVAKQIAKTEPQTVDLGNGFSVTANDTKTPNYCATCRYKDTPFDDLPCDMCKSYSAYEPMTEPFANDINVRSKTEPQTCNNCDQQRCETCVTEIGKDEQIAHSRADGKERVMTEVYCTFDDCIFYKPHDEDYGICTKDHITLDEEVSGRTYGCPDAEWGEPQTDCSWK